MANVYLEVKYDTHTHTHTHTHKHRQGRDEKWSTAEYINDGDTDGDLCAKCERFLVTCQGNKCLPKDNMAPVTSLDHGKKAA